MTRSEFFKFVKLIGWVFAVDISPIGNLIDGEDESYLAEEDGGGYTFSLTDNGILVSSDRGRLYMPDMLISRIEVKQNLGISVKNSYPTFEVTGSFFVGDVAVINGWNEIDSLDEFYELEKICDRYNEEMRGSE